VLENCLVQTGLRLHVLRAYYVDLALPIICQPKCASLVTIWHSKDEINPSSKISTSVKMWVRFPIALRFLIGYSSHRFPQCLSSTCGYQ
jgi:hypothetical protein